ncbi:hypothetical protein GCM10010345_92500 [Streptomyces canarius]|uniref:Uncharacterized protein n=1 Tax=Streptomyces canarius TaxID=285453 RepID=A0ABQ3DC42_9ACTN|nr:hypothetical protein GCM10010345_92500 [Streptomyces canarius]
MAGVAGGALQTGRRLGGAIGTAVLPGLYYLAKDEHDGPSAAVALSVGAGTLAVGRGRLVLVDDVLPDQPPGVDLDALTPGPLPDPGGP